MGDCSSQCLFKAGVTVIEAAPLLSCTLFHSFRPRASRRNRLVAVHAVFIIGRKSFLNLVFLVILECRSSWWLLLVEVMLPLLLPVGGAFSRRHVATFLLLAAKTAKIAHRNGIELID